MGGPSGVQFSQVTGRAVLCYTLCPPLLIFKPTGGSHGHEKSHDQETGDHSASAHAETNDDANKYSAMRPLMTIALTCLALSRFAVSPALSDPNSRNLVIAAWAAPAGSELAVSAFWASLLLLMVWASCQHLPSHVHGLDYVLIPEIVALALFFVADTYLEAFKVLDADLDAMISVEEVKQQSPGLLAVLWRRWLSGNFAALLSFTITESISPQTFGLSGLIFDAGWAIVFSQGVALFLSNTLCRSAALASWAHAYRGSVTAALLYGFSLYYYTHALALIGAIVFRKHEGVDHPPTVARVWRAVARQNSKEAMMRGIAFVLGLLFVVIMPALVDHPMPQTSGHEGHGHMEPHLLHAVAAGLLSGPCGCFALSCISTCAIMAAIRCYMRPQVKKVKASYEAALAWILGGLGSLAWCGVLAGEGSSDAPWWQYAAAVTAFLAHIFLASFSADVFAGRQVPDWTEANVVTFWAALQLVEGLAAEHHAATSHHCHSMDVGALLAHLGEFGLCEFGLIITLAWISDNMCYLYKKFSKMPAPKYGQGSSSLTRPLAYVKRA
mmetsp:Transcript_45759/g.106247  ORF Transcript_45759/g.106247 Transcript_45759/m.106247 type:complete len:555 (+) Transcript_45759:57-1721(+)